MKKIILLLCVALLSTGMASAKGINFMESKTWKETLAKAKRENKLIFLDAYATWCGPCKYLQSDVFTQSAVGDYYNKTYINVKIDMEDGEGIDLAKRYKVTAYPTLFFIDGDGQVMHKYVGALDADGLISLGKDASDPEKQQFKVNQKITSGAMDAKTFHDWVHAAEKEENEEAKAVIAGFLGKTTASIFDKDILAIVFEHAGTVPDQILKRLIAGKAEILKLRKITDDEFTQWLTRKAAAIALEESYVNEVLDADQYRSVIARYNTGAAEMETQRVLVRYYFVKEETEKALNTLAGLIATPALKYPALVLASEIMDRSEEIVAAERQAEFISKIKAYELPATDLDKVYYVDFALLCIYHEMDDETEMKKLAEKIKANSNTPDVVRELTDKFLGQE